MASAVMGALPPRSARAAASRSAPCAAAPASATKYATVPLESATASCVGVDAAHTQRTPAGGSHSETAAYGAVACTCVTRPSVTWTSVSPWSRAQCRVVSPPGKGPGASSVMASSAMASVLVALGNARTSRLWCRALVLARSAHSRWGEGGSGDATTVWKGTVLRRVRVADVVLCGGTAGQSTESVVASKRAVVSGLSVGRVPVRAR